MAASLSVYRQCLRSVQQSEKIDAIQAISEKALYISFTPDERAGFRGDQFMLHNSRKELRSKFEVQNTKAGSAHSIHDYAGDDFDKPRAVLTRTLL